MLSVVGHNIFGSFYDDETGKSKMVRTTLNQKKFAYRENIELRNIKIKQIESIENNVIILGFNGVIYDNIKNKSKFVISTLFDNSFEYKQMACGYSLIAGIDNNNVLYVNKNGWKYQTKLSFEPLKFYSVGKSEIVFITTENKIISAYIREEPHINTVLCNFEEKFQNISNIIEYRKCLNREYVLTGEGTLYIDKQRVNLDINKKIVNLSHGGDVIYYICDDGTFFYKNGSAVFVDLNIDDINMIHCNEHLVVIETKQGEIYVNPTGSRISKSVYLLSSQAKFYSTKYKLCIPKCSTKSARKR